ncbi:RNA cytosine-C(5)-methyltransferase NSUN2 [Acropora cervicornis]|uniref:RNA cytosine-C(5)-methyltransferase NSUN2 n=1 Tax=Acropora cervicornis TaxID=6130 RepID=A0AAD9PWL3_ACRCE|nr:RNA cytosine-C(5)-methyltransferase NSUN2 [Acropora cervicornis]
MTSFELSEVKFNFLAGKSSTASRTVNHLISDAPGYLLLMLKIQVDSTKQRRMVSAICSTILQIKERALSVEMRPCSLEKSLEFNRATALPMSISMRNSSSSMPRQRGRNKSHPKGQWVDVVRKSDLFEQYYKIQHILPEDEFPAFLEALQKELPSTIRITGTRSHAKELSIAMQRLFLTKLDTVEDEEGKTADPPKPLSWYPDELAWQINLTKRFIRKSSSMDRFHKFLVHETETDIENWMTSNMLKLNGDKSDIMVLNGPRRPRIELPPITICDESVFKSDSTSLLGIEGNISRQEAVSMIPPLLLDIKSGQKILDACAAPGSKTVQLIELLHGEESSGIPDGLVVANELQNKRCYMLVHQSKRLHSPCCLITNHDAAMFPSMFVKTWGWNAEEESFDLEKVDTSTWSKFISAKVLDKSCPNTNY